MKVKETKISGVYTVETDRHEDSRGFFCRAFCDTELHDLLSGRSIRQINVSETQAIGAVRGLHFQYAPKAEMKLIRCLKGSVWDVVVDLRTGSKTFLEWVAFELDDRHSTLLVIPEGCAHGFQVMEAGSQLLYLHTERYAPECEGAVRYDDPRIGISWPLSISERSDRDMNHPYLDDEFTGVNL